MSIDTKDNPAAASDGNDRLLDVLLPWIDRNRWWIFAFILLLYIGAFNGQWRVGSDSASYLNAARAFVDEGHYGYVDQTISPHRYPGLTMMVGIIFKITGSQSMIVPQIVMLLMGLSVVFLTYRLICRCENRPVAVIVALLVAVSDSIFQQSFEMLTDLPFALGVMLFLNGWEDARDQLFKAGNVEGDAVDSSPKEDKALARGRKQNITAVIISLVMISVGLALAISLKRTMWILLAAVVVTVVMQFLTGRLKWKYAAGGLVAAVAAMGLFLLFDPRRGSYDYSREFLLHLFEKYSASELLAKIGSHIALLFEQNVVDAAFAMPLAPGLNSAATLLILALTIGVLAKRRLWGVYVILFLLALLLHQPSSRYFVAIFPFMAYGWYRGSAWLNQKLPQPWANILCAVMLLLWIGPNTVKAAGLIIEQRTMPFIAHYNSGQYQSMMKLSDRLRELASSDDIIVATESSVFAYYSERKVINHRNLNRWSRRDVVELESLVDQDITIFIVEPLRPVLKEWIDDRLQWSLGPVIEQWPASDEDDPPWMIRKVTGRREP